MDDRSRFAEMLMAENRTLHAFAYSIARTHEDAEEIVQKTAGVMWEKYDEYEQGTSFGAWARAVLYRVAMNHVRARKKSPVLCEPATLEKLSRAYDQVDGSFTSPQLLDALDECVERLSDKQRRMVHLKYAENERSGSLAKMFSMSVQAVDAALYRVRRWLESCIRATLAGEEVEA